MHRNVKGFKPGRCHIYGSGYVNTNAKMYRYKTFEKHQYVESNMVSCYSASCLVLFCNLKKKTGKNRCCCCSSGCLIAHLFWTELLIRFAFRETLSICVCASFPLGF